MGIWRKVYLLIHMILIFNHMMKLQLPSFIIFTTTLSSQFNSLQFIISPFTAIRGSIVALACFSSILPRCLCIYEYYCQTASPILRFVDSISFDLHGLVARTAALIPRKAELHNLMSLFNFFSKFIKVFKLVG